MKKQLSLLLVLSILLFSGANAQDDEKEKKKPVRKTHHSMLFEIGLNNYLTESGQFPDATNELYMLKPAGSLYLSLGSIYHTRIAGPLYLEWGGDVNWYNFKYQDPSVEPIKTVDGVNFQQNTDTAIDPVKGKMTVSYLNGSFIPMLKFGSRKNEFRLGAGFYGGYRLGSYYKLKYERDGQGLKSKDKDNFYLENLRYGVKARFGFRDMNLFAAYDLNTLFVAGKGPELHTISAGIAFSDLFD